MPFSSKCLALSFCLSVLIGYSTQWNFIWMMLTYVVSNTIIHFITKQYCKPYTNGKNPKHLVVCVTGWLGHYVPFKPLQNSFKKYLTDHANLIHDDMMIYLARSNSDGLFFYAYYKTNDGFEKGGERLCNEIKTILKTNPSINKISFIGCSLGGIYSRYCIKLLFNDNNNINIKPMNLITMATPHCGCQDWLKKTNISLCGYKLISLYHAAKLLTKYKLFPYTLKQLALLDEQHLLIKMASDNEYLKPLQLFRNRICFGNGRYDKLVSFSSSLLLFGREEAKIGIHFYDKMVSDNNKFSVQQIDNKSDSDEINECLFNGLRDIEWKKIVVCWAKNVFGNTIHKRTATVADPLFATIIQNFKF